MSQDGRVIAFPMHRVPRLQSLSDDQVTRLIWLLNQTELLEKLLYHQLPAIKNHCPLGREILKDL